MGLNIASETTQERIANALEMIALQQTDPTGEDFDPAAAQSLVRHGLGPASYPVGTQFKVSHSTYGVHKYNVIGQDHDKDARGLHEHSMTIQMDDTITDTTLFDAPEAFVYAAKELPAGTYHFTIGALNSVPAGTYQFTLQSAVPAGGQIMLVKNGTTWNLTTYSGPTSTAAIETVTATGGSEGTDLGDASVKANTHAGMQAAAVGADATAVLNYPDCTQWGYNRWSQSAIRQWLNSDKAANEWWKPQNVFDRVPGYANRPGFLAGFDPALVAVMGDITHSAALNNVTDGGTCETVTDKVFLLSRAEVGLGVEITGQDDGSVYTYYADATNADRIKLRGPSAVGWWLRTPYSGYAHNVRSVSTPGALSGNGAYGANGVAPACVIL